MNALGNIRSNYKIERKTLESAAQVTHNTMSVHAAVQLV
jgi:hypothetical protein